MAPHCFKLSVGQVLAETMESTYRYLPTNPLKNLLEKLNILYRICRTIEDEENVIAYITIALMDIIESLEEKNPHCISMMQSSIISLGSHSAVSLRTIMNRMYDIIDECRNLDDGEEISEAISTVIHHAKVFHPRSTVYLLGQRDGI